MSTPPSVNRGYEGQQKPNPPQVPNPPAGRQRSSDYDFCEIHNWAIALVFFHLCVGGTVFFIYFALLTGASEIQVGQCELKENTNITERPHEDPNSKNIRDYEACLRDNDKKKQNTRIYRVSLAFGLGCSFFMAVCSILLLIATAKKNRKYSCVCHVLGWIPLIFFGVISGALNDTTTHGPPPFDFSVNTYVYFIWCVFLFTKIVECIIFYKFNQKLKRLENNDDAWIGVQNNYSNQVHPTTSENIYNHCYNHV